MSKTFNAGETAKVSGTYLEVGHGGGTVKNGKKIFVNQGENLPELKPYTVTIEHKGVKKNRNRQHRWQLL